MTPCQNSPPSQHYLTPSLQKKRKELDEILADTEFPQQGHEFELCRLVLGGGEGVRPGQNEIQFQVFSTSDP